METVRGIVYMISNSVDDQVYVGSTKIGLNKGWNLYRNGHNYPSHNNYNMKICQLMREYGFDKFKIEILEQGEFEDRTKLFTREGWWQNKLKGDGYNLANTQVAHGISKKKGEPGYSVEYFKANPESYQKKLTQQKEQISCEICNVKFTRSNKSRHMKKFHTIST